LRVIRGLPPGSGGGPRAADSAAIDNLIDNPKRNAARGAGLVPARSAAVPLNGASGSDHLRAISVGARGSALFLLWSPRVGAAIEPAPIKEAA
jgi:hypothetical protein